MNTDGAPQDNKVSKRRAWIFTRASRPGFGDLMAGGERRRAFTKYWVKDTLVDLIDFSVHFILRAVPMDLCSHVGARIGSFAIPRYFKVQVTRARALIAYLHPDLDDTARGAMLTAYMAAQGRLMTEFSIITRLLRHQDRILLNGFQEHMFAAARKGPVIIVGMHLGNWEIGPIILHDEGIRPYANYVPPKGRAKAWISARVRAAVGLNFLPPGLTGVRPSLKILKNGGAISMFCDEGAGGKIRGPLFGREPHAQGNLAVAVRLSRMTGAPICPWYNLRRDGARYEAWSLPAIILPPEDKPGARLMDDIALVNGVIEPVIRANLAQWYFIDNEIPT